MEYSLQRLSKTKVEADVSVAKEEWDTDIHDAYNKNRHNYIIEGFRKGKVPMSMLVNRYGKQYFFEDALDIALEKAYSEILDKENIDVVARPDVDIKELSDDGVKVAITFITKPEFELGQYTGLTFKKEVAEVTDEEIQKAVDKEINERARMVEKDTPAEKGDTVVLDYSGSIDGSKFEGGTAEKQTLELGSNSFIPGFEDQVIGMKKDDSKDIEVTFPENYNNKDVAGKKAVFAITVHEVQKKELPALDDEFVKDIDDELDTVEQWKEKLKKQILEQKEKNADNKLENDIVEEILGKTDIELPDCMIEEELDYRVQEMERSMAQYGLKLADYLKYTGETIEKIRTEKKDEAVRNIKIRLILEEICKKENLTVTAEEIKAKVDEAKIGEEHRREAENYFANQILTDKLFAFLKEKNDIQ